MRYQIVAGSPIITTGLRQPGAALVATEGMEDQIRFYQRQADQRAQFLLDMMYSALRSVRGIGEVELAETKSLGRAFTKAVAEKDSDPSNITDYARGTIWVNSPEQIIRLANLFRPCNNALVRQFDDGFANPDPKNNLRRLKVIVDLGDHYGEIQVLHKGMEKTYAETRTLYGFSRAIRDRLKTCDAETMSPDVLLATMRKADHFDAERRERHARAAAYFGLDSLLEQRRYQLHLTDNNDILPSVLISGGTYERPALIVPFAASNRFVEQTEGAIVNSQGIPINRQEFIAYSRDAVLNANPALVAKAA
jgi:hypothetical protein